MRFERVRASGFGPLVDEELELAPGLNVIYGANETGKSSWHAAVYAALCGQRRGRGRRGKEEQSFADRHRPWSETPWIVECTVRLDDGRVVRLIQNLDDGMSWRATDAFGRDISPELLREGVPDGAVLLGMDRFSFLATACIRQADLMGVVDDSARLQDYLQRAAATARADSSAAAALERLKEFRAERVGLDRANSTKPLRRARQRVDQASNALQEATAAHEQFVRADDDAAGLEHEAASREGQLRLAEAAHAAELARSFRHRVERVTELSARYPSEPAARTTDDKLAQQIASALDAWRNIPSPPQPLLETSDLLRVELDSLPSAPGGDRRSHPTVDSTRRELELARSACDLHESSRVTPPSFPAAGGLDADDLRLLATALAGAGGRQDVRPRTPEKRSALRPSRIPVLIGGILATVGLVVALAFAWIPGVVLALAGGSIAVLSSARRHKGHVRRVLLHSELRSGEDEGLDAKRLAEAKVRELGLEPDLGALLRLADRVAEARHEQRLLDQWEGRGAELLERLKAAETALIRALEARGVVVDGPVVDADIAYLAKCQERAEMALASSRRKDLELRLDSCLRAEEAARVVDVQRRAVNSGVEEAADAVGVSAPTVELLAEQLAAWLAGRERDLEANEGASRQWSELQTLLDGQKQEDLEHELRLVEGRSRDLTAGLDPTEIRLVKAEDLASEIVDRRELAREAREEANRAAGRVATLAERLPNVAETQEDLASAQEELARIERLAQTLDRTLEFLRQAQERVHRDLAPALNRSIGNRLPLVTQGRYRDVRVDPETLTLRVGQPDGTLRDARLLSHGTAEQLYLLLRIAMAEHLALSDETCPLLLDDVTAQSDGPRTRAILALLKQLSAERQIVFFTQEDTIREWAQGGLDPVRDRYCALVCSATAQICSLPTATERKVS
jgi:hypothetical protein